MSSASTRKSSPKPVKINHTLDAANAVSSLIKLITSGPRFQKHLADICIAQGLTATDKQTVLRKGLRTYLGYN